MTDLYRETYRRGIEMELATDAQHIGEDLYVVIANAVINRDLPASARAWAHAKVENRAKLDLVAKAADDPAERQQVALAGAALDEIIEIYERKMLPLIQAGAVVPGPLSEIDASIDAKIELIDRSLQTLAHSMSAENAKASRDFHSVLQDSITAGVSFSLLGVLAAMVISTLTTRKIVRPMREITDAAHELARGNYEVEVRHQSSDEAGVLAHAFRTMTGEVARRTGELQVSNERLNREVGERKLSEAEVIRLNAELEERVAQRTAELVQTNERLELVVQAQQEAEHELQRSRAELRSLSRHLQKVREEERTTSRGRSTTSWDRRSPAEVRRLLDGRGLPRNSAASRQVRVGLPAHRPDTHSVRRIATELRPSVLDQLGLAAAIEWQAPRIRALAPASRCEIDSCADDIAIPNALRQLGCSASSRSR